MRAGVRRASIALALVTVAAATAAAQSLDGYVSAVFNAFPNLDATPGEQRPVLELRPRLKVEGQTQVGSVLRLTAAGFVEGLLADRRTGSTLTGGIARPQELHAEFVWPKADLRVGISRVAWGRLDEFLPTDVVNPLDLSRFFMEGRSEARIANGMIRGRIVPSDRFNIEAIFVPLFRRGSFDQLDEETAPFNLAPQVPRLRDEPDRRWANTQGGVRINATSGRVDWSVTGYRGFESFPVYEIDPPSDAVTIRERFPRFEMVGGDFETAGGAWGVRGEVAWFRKRVLQAIDQPLSGLGEVIEGGIGVDHTGATYRIGGNVVISWRRSLDNLPVDTTDALVVFSLDRSFARDTHQLRTFAAYDTQERSVFARAIASFAMRDNVRFELSGAWFDGTGLDLLSRLANRDFASAAFKVFF